ESASSLWKNNRPSSNKYRCCTVADCQPDECWSRCSVSGTIELATGGNPPGLHDTHVKPAACASYSNTSMQRPSGGVLSTIAADSRVTSGKGFPFAGMLS